MKKTSTFWSSLLFAYHLWVGVENTIINLLQQTHSHLNKAGSTMRMMFFNFSSAFNTIQSALLSKKLQKTWPDAFKIAWITDCLTSRPRFVRLNGCVSEQVVCSTGGPQGTVLSLFLFTLYTSDFQTVHLHAIFLLYNSHFSKHSASQAALN